jgi:hypothetical protein
MAGTVILQTRQLVVIWGDANPTGKDRDAGEHETLDRSPSAPYAYSNLACWGIDVRLRCAAARLAMAWPSDIFGVVGHRKRELCPLIFRRR